MDDLRNLIPPSRADIWGSPGGCQGWGKMVSGLPEAPESMPRKAAKEAKKVALDLICDRLVDIDPDSEVYEAAKVFADDVAGVYRLVDLDPDLRYGDEVSVNTPRIHKNSIGKVPYHIYSPKKESLNVWIYSHSRTAIDVRGHLPLVNYAAGLMAHYDLNGAAEFRTVVHMRIVQPLAYHKDGTIRTWTVTAPELRPYVNRLEIAANRAYADDAPIRSGPHCRYCLARTLCESALRSGMAMYEVASSVSRQQLDPRALARQYEIVCRAREQLKGLEDGYYAEMVARVGEVPGYTIEATVGRLNWTAPVDKVASLGDLMGVDLRKPVDLITPTQAKKKLSNELILQFSAREPGALKLVKKEEEL